MQTHSSSRLVSNPSSNSTSSMNPNPKGRNCRHSKQRIENFNLDDLSPPIVTMADQRTMAQFLQEPTEGYEDAVVVLAITADNFELKHGLLTLVQNKQFLNMIKKTRAAQIWLEKEPPRSIFTWDDLISKFINQFFPPSKTTNLHNEITNFQQRFDESFSEAWDRFKDLLRACPHHDNDAVMRNMQTQGQNMQNQLTNLTDLITKFVNSNSASTSSSGTLPSNMIANLKSDLKAITTRSGVSYDGPQILPPPSSLSKVVENKPEVTNDTVDPTKNGNTKDVQPQAVQSESPILISKHPGTVGSSKGTGSIPGVLDESIVITATSSKGTGTKVTSKDKFILEWGSEQESDYTKEEDDDEIIKWVDMNEKEEKKVNDDEDEEMINDEFEESRNDDEEITDATKSPFVLTVHVSVIFETSVLTPIPETPLVAPATTLLPPLYVSIIPDVLLQTTTPIPAPPITTEAPTVTIVILKSDALIVVQLRVAKLENDMSELKKINHSAEALATLKS
uniref:Reverse transcriptase domain-containing protein n=1 Tax=Tanacetum cinerariifolium TaxID=118510 RepID=A0A6L2M9E8_TANCI|nr:reverse transcriptase domain-containing protein [Tanacetum cinerariifolium]